MSAAPIQVGDRFRSNSGCIYRVDHIQPVMGCFVTVEGEHEQTLLKHRELRQMKRLAPHARHLPGGRMNITEIWTEYENIIMRRIAMVEHDEIDARLMSHASQYPKTFNGLPARAFYGMTPAEIQDAINGWTHAFGSKEMRKGSDDCEVCGGCGWVKGEWEPGGDEPCPLCNEQGADDE